MDIRILRYFLTVAKEQNFTKAAEQLNITQPTLSRQLASLEEELGTALFVRGSRSITLTEAGILLKRRALEIIDLEEKMLDEIKAREELIEGMITVGCGEFAAVETLAEICKIYKKKYPMIQIALHTATADTVYDMMLSILDIPSGGGPLHELYRHLLKIVTSVDQRSMRFARQEAVVLKRVYQICSRCILR